MTKATAHRQEPAAYTVTPRAQRRTDDDERLIDWQANARLIAAAPEMFAALVALLPHAARAIQGTTEGQPLLDAAAAAITKATQEPTP